MRITMLLLFWFLTVCAQATPAQLEIVKLQGDVKVDGDLSDDAWKNARRVETFVEYFRGDNTVPPAPTVGYIGYDEDSVYVAFHNADPSPQNIRAPLVDRDKVLGDQDYVAILIDTQNDRRSGVAFRVNPRGVQTDSIVNDAVGEEDFSPDFFYEAVARRTKDGWSAEMRIPLSSLRYPSSDPQTWGVILMRNYPRDFRYIMANTNIPKNSGCFLCHAATLTGLTGLPTASHFTLTPYAASSHERAVSTTQENDLGFDLKWKPSTKLTLDATLNPDFSQVEADVPQLDANSRFALSYPEKRNFFLEGVDLLNTPIRAVYTRSITAPAWGVRATGESGANAYTFLLAQDRGGGSVVLPGRDGSEFAPQDFRSHVAIGRVRRSIGESFVAMMLSARESEGGAHNRVLGPDFMWRRNATDKLHGQFLFTSTTNPNRPDLSAQLKGQSFDGHGYRVYFQRDTKTYDIWAATSGYSEGFRADNGFVTQTSLRRAGLWVGRRFYPKSFISYLRPYSGAEADVAYSGSEVLREGLFQGFEFQGRWGSSGWMTAMAQRERVGGEMLRRNSVEFNLRAAPYRWLPAIQLDGEVGDKIDYAGARRGSGATLNLRGTVRATDHLQLELMTSREWLDLDFGTLFTANIDWLKVTYTFSPRTLVRVIGQQRELTRHNGTHDRRTSFSALYAYRLNWQTVFFAGFGDASANGDPVQDSQSVFMKVAYAIQR